MRGSTSGSMPMPVSATSTTSQRPGAPPSVRAHGDRAARGRELDGVLDQVPEDLRQARRVGPDAVVVRRQLARPAQAVGGDLPRAAGLDGVGEERRHVDLLAAQLELAALDARQVEQVVDQAGLQLDVAPHIASVVAQLGGQPAVLLEAETTARTGVSGVRSSWLRAARNWSLASLVAAILLAVLLLGQIGHHQA